MSDIATRLIEFGADPAALHLLDRDGPELLPYATLISARQSGDNTLDAVSAVYEWQGAPLIFLVDADSLGDDRKLHRVRRLLAMRGDAPYLGVVAPGRLDVYRLALDNRSIRQSRVELESSQNAKAATFAHLANIRPKAAISQRNWISNIVLNLLTGSITQLIASGRLSDEDAISLAGRALFTRFLADRNLLPPVMSEAGMAATLFDTREAAERTSKWLDKTFNGDLLPLSQNVFDNLPARAYHTLGDMLRRAPDSQLFLGWEEKWNNLDFAQIPVGVLSQAYELYLRRHAPLKQRREGGYYTPRRIADLMVRASFHALQRNGSASIAKILDPAAGAGVFLLTAFRELIAGRWRADGRRPQTDTLRSILYNQIVGFDVNEAALRFAALGLYLMSIELDPNPKPVNKLGFKDLRGTVLYRVNYGLDDTGVELGSLGPLVGNEHLGRYDLVIGNPPWASGTKLRDWNFVCETVARIAASREIPTQSPPLPNEGLDLPFVWRAMEWAKPNGQIAFALHARFLFQQGDGMAQARQAIFEALDITSIINGAELRQTKVWPEIAAPFSILLATNRVPSSGAGFRLISPRLEGTLNEAGSMRIDAMNAEIVPSKQLAETPEILKILFRGTRADLGILERVRSQGNPTLESFWRDTIGSTDAGHLAGSGNGYQKLRPSSQARRVGDGLPGEDATHLRGIPEVTAASFKNVIIDSSLLDVFSSDRVHRSRSTDLFTHPILIVHKSPPARTGRIGVAISESDVVFNETFYGYSPIGYSDASTLVRYLALVLGSKLALWMALITSGEFGFEREVIEKATLDRIPIPDFRRLEQSRLDQIKSLFETLQSDAGSWDEVDEWVSSLYGLGRRDLKVISDTLEFNLPFAENKRKAQEFPALPELQRFRDVLAAELSPWCERFGSQIDVHLSDWPVMSPWCGIELRTSMFNFSDGIQQSDWAGILHAADIAAASEVLLRNGSNGLITARLAQRRYWSETQARLLAQRIIWSHVDLLKGGPRA